ncbi:MULTISPECIES: 1-phosphofructokinase [Pediococcus]|jgi:1-phosphofructokinase|uniref:1-phosphofructokinase n=1 Tax=Pediococcus TaxID=1253 RepID=UPI00070BEB7F|nr:MULTISPECIES: 1-phosphofructokinase [Pediococcus]MCT3027608.1 1-phosphofructokinase [Pediococcus parvulus]MCT3028649.1 1-phosphofructokinase [Pediococcus parvulus]MDN5574529.1 1-phosphofructokinase [Pediococcus sp.]GEL89710.1 tagatose-6-phosphate kinase [Pediococcus parvulus]GHC10594.1 tagatose-6-phosphate kinase [Pediococcus parvulus]
MIYTVTLNPSIDYVVQLPKLNLGEVNRLETSYKFPGGKGINVSRILRELGYANQAWGFLGGFTGEFVSDKLNQLNLDSHFTKIADDTRINVKLKADQETELNAAGPKITKAEKQVFVSQFDELKENDVVIFSGSVPSSLPETFYFDLIQKVKERHAEYAVDTTGEALKKTLPTHPVVVKPNNHELADLFGVELNSLAEIKKYGQKLIAMGAQNVMISMAGDGGMLVTKDHCYRSAAPKGTVQNSVGAGDSMLAGFTGTFDATHDPVESFRYGLACGSATAFSADIATKAKIDEILPQIKIEEF